jgi:hypothetical protein
MESKECLSGLLRASCACKMHGRSLVYRQENKSRYRVSEKKQTLLLRTLRAINISSSLTLLSEHLLWWLCLNGPCVYPHSKRE